ncbi:MAG: phage baseplate assembly protein V [Leptospiraceae bacterium]|nr:phage baseplate assembly protein V [Leptospiraceae bacterium]
MIKVGRVVAVDEKRACVRVELTDCDGVITYWLPVVVPKTQHDKFYFLPDIGEEVVCAFLEHGIEQGFVLGAIYNEKDRVPVVNKDKYHVRFADGTEIEYDRKNHKLKIKCVGDVEIVANGNVTIIGKRIDLNP